MRRTGYVYAERYLLHDPGSWHPERPDRLKAIQTSLVESGVLELLVRSDPTTPRWPGWSACMIPTISGGSRRPASRVKQILDTQDCGICRDSYMTALLAVGGVMAGGGCRHGGRVG